MAEHEVLDMIPAETVARIRSADPHPEFRVFSVGHEGDANANVLGHGMRVLRYAKDIVVQMFSRIRYGLPTFNRHDPNTNSHNDREVVGEVVGKTMKSIGEALHALVAVYIKPEHRGKELDIASIEGNLEAEERADGTWGVVNLSQITGLALSNHTVDTPGMPGATLQAALQMFTQKYGRFQQMSKLTKEEIRDAIRESGLRIDEIYTADEIVASEPAKKSKQQEYEHAKRVEQKLGEAREENAGLQSKVAKLEGDNAGLLEKANAGLSRDMLGTIAAEKKLDPKFKTFVEKNIKDFKSAKTGDEFKSELERFVDGQAKEYAAMGKLYGFEAKVTTAAPRQDGSQDGDQGGAHTPAADGQPAQDGDPQASTYEDPAKNDFIPAV